MAVTAPDSISTCPGRAGQAISYPAINTVTGRVGPGRVGKTTICDPGSNDGAGSLGLDDTGCL